MEFWNLRRQEGRQMSRKPWCTPRHFKTDKRKRSESGKQKWPQAGHMQRMQSQSGKSTRTGTGISRMENQKGRQRCPKTQTTTSAKWIETNGTRTSLRTRPTKLGGGRRPKETDTASKAGRQMPLTVRTQVWKQIGRQSWLSKAPHWNHAPRRWTTNCLGKMF